MGRGFYPLAILQGVLALATAVTGSLVLAVTLAVGAILLVIGQLLLGRRADASAEVSLGLDLTAIQWVMLLSFVIAGTACCLVVAIVGLIAAEPVGRSTAALLLGVAALGIFSAWLLARRAPE